MGQDQSKNQTEVFSMDKLYCPIDMEVQTIDRFKTLGCGHCFCIGCLESWKKQNLIQCPTCRYEERNHLRDLPQPNEFKGKVFVEQASEAGHLQEMKTLLHAQMIRRVKTIR